MSKRRVDGFRHKGAKVTKQDGDESFEGLDRSGQVVVFGAIWYNLDAPRVNWVGNVLSQHVLKGSLTPKGTRKYPLRRREGTHLRNAGFKTRLFGTTRSFALPMFPKPRSWQMF